MFTWRIYWFLSEIKAGHWFTSRNIFTDIISDYFTDSDLESSFRFKDKTNIKINGSPKRKRPWAQRVNCFKSFSNRLFSYRNLGYTDLYRFADNSPYPTTKHWYHGFSGMKSGNNGPLNFVKKWEKIESGRKSDWKDEEGSLWL